MRRHSQRHHLSTLAEINVNPLLDLAFVLLIIFMITTPLLEKSMDLAVPTSSTAVQTVNPAEVQTINITRDRVLQLNGQSVTREELRLRLDQLKTANPGIAVVIRPHRDLPVQDFIAVMDLLKAASIAKVGVMTQSETLPQ